MAHGILHDVEACHDTLATRLDRAEHARPTRARPRDRYPDTDTFLAVTARHLAAATAVLVPAVRRRLPDGRSRAAAFVRASKELEVALNRAKAKLYGEAGIAHLAWSEVWERIEARLDEVRRLEADLARALVDQLPDDACDRLADDLHHAELRAPTRPHPFVPHTGLRGRVARGICRRVDLFLDTAEGRMVPQPERSHDREHDGKLAQYLLADPHLRE